MSGTFPATPAAASVNIQSWTPTLVSQAQDLTRQVRARGGQRWIIEVEWPVMTRAQASPIFGFAVAQRGQYEEFSYVPPVISSTRGTAITAAVAGASQTGRTVVIAAITGTLKTGDYIKFANHDKVYMLTADVANAAEAMTIEPALVTSPADSSAITVLSVPFKVAFANDIQQMPSFDVGFYTYKATFVESP